MQPITYRKKRVFEGGEGYVLASFIFIMTAAFQIFQPPIWESPDGQDIAHRGIAALSFCALAAISFSVTLPKYNALQLDEDDLTYRRAGQRGAWPWRDISAFTIARGWRGPRIGFTVSGRHGRRWRIARLRRTKAGLAVTIPDIWDAPLEEIAATLNACRDRALGGGTA